MDATSDFENLSINSHSVAWFGTSMHVCEAFSIAMNVLAFYLVIRHSPPSLASYRWCLLDISVRVAEERRNGRDRGLAGPISAFGGPGTVIWTTVVPLDSVPRSRTNFVVSVPVVERFKVPWSGILNSPPCPTGPKY